MNYSSFILKLEERIQQIGLPGEVAHHEMFPLKRPAVTELQDQLEQYRQSAVGIHFHPINNQPHFVLLRRPSYEGKHSGQMAFPGGKLEMEDLDLEACARRESEEETGIPRTSGRLISSLTEIAIPVSNFRVQPYIFAHDATLTLIAEPREVDELFNIPVEALLDEENKRLTEIKLSNGMTMKNVPYFQLNDQVVWGATAIILNELKTILK